MWSIRFLPLSLVAFALPLGGGVAQQPSSDTLLPSEITFSNQSLTLIQVLAELQKQTGNLVQDSRSNTANPKIALGQKKYTFWQALDAIAKDANVDFTTAGGVTLVDRPYRETKVHYSGPFRFAFKRITVSRDEETKAHLCHVAFDVAWEPRIRPLFFNFDGGESAFRPDAKKASVQTKLDSHASHKISGRGSTELELTLPAPARQVTHLESIKGNIKILGAPKILEFRFAKLEGPLEAEKEGVKIRAKVDRSRQTRWTVSMEEVLHPTDAIPKVQSFEEPDLRAFLHQRIWLAWDGVELEKSGVEGSGTFNFVFGKGAAPPKDAAVTLHFQTPNRVAYYTIPFEFKNLPLP